MLTAAKKLFAQKGYDGTSVKELADAAGVNISLVSYHFEGKEGLYRSCISDFGQQRLKTAERILQTPSSPEEFKVRLKMFIAEMFVCHLDEPEISAIVHREVEQQLPLIPDLFRDTFLKVFETLVNFLKAAQKKKFIKASLDPRQMTIVLFGSMMHFCKSDHIMKKYFGCSLDDARYRAEAADTIFRIFTTGVEADK